MSSFRAGTFLTQLLKEEIKRGDVEKSKFVSRSESSATLRKGKTSPRNVHGLFGRRAIRPLDSLTPTKTKASLGKRCILSIPRWTSLEQKSSASVKAKKADLTAYLKKAIE